MKFRSKIKSFLKMQNNSEMCSVLWKCSETEKYELSSLVSGISDDNSK